MTPHHRNITGQRFLQVAFLLLTALLLTTSCIKEDRSNCPQTKIIFYYDADGTRNVIGQYIHNAVIYAFNAETGEYVGSNLIGGDVLTSSTPWPIDLPEGQYKFVVWGGDGEHTLLPPHGKNFNESILSHPLYSNAHSKLLDTHDELYYAIANIDMDKMQTEPYVIDFRSAHVNIEIYVKGWKRKEAPLIFLHHFTPEYDFTRTPLKVGDISYRLAVNYDIINNYYFSRVATLRGFNPDPTILEIKNLDNTIQHSFSFGDYLREYAKKKGIVLSEIEELTIPILIELEGPDISIRIPRWESGNIVPDL